MDHVTSSLQACQWFPDIPAQIQVGAWSSKSNKGLSDTPGLLPHAPPFSLCSPHLRASHLPCPLPRQPFSHPYLTLSLSSPRHLPKAIIPQGLCPDPGSALHRRSICLGPPHSCPEPAPGAGIAGEPGALLKRARHAVHQDREKCVIQGRGLRGRAWARSWEARGKHLLPAML